MKLLLIILLLLKLTACVLQRKVAVLISYDNQADQPKLQNKIRVTINETFDGSDELQVELQPEFVTWNSSAYNHVNALQVAYDLICPKLLNQSVAILLIQTGRRPKVAQELFASVAYTVGFYRVPVLGIIRSSAEFSKKELYPTFLPISPPFFDEVSVFVQLINRLNYRNIVLITSNDIDGQEFGLLFKQQAKNIHIQKHVELEIDDLHSKFSESRIEEAMPNTVVFYSSQELAEKFFAQNDQNSQIGRVWLISEAASRAKNLPTGMLAVRMHLDLINSVRDAMMVLRSGAQLLAQFNETSLPPAQCKKMMRTANEWTNTDGMRFYDKLAGMEIDRKALYEIVNSQTNGQLNVVGFMIQNSALNLDEKEIVWPGGTKLKPLEITLPKHLRALTVRDDPPFVFSFPVANASQCHKYQSIRVDGTNVAGPWIECSKREETTQEMLSYCCAGLAIELLIKLSQMKVSGRQQAFTFDLFINESYGAVLLDKKGGYYLSGIIGELDTGRGDLAIGALSVNPERKLHLGLSIPWLYHGIQILEKWKPRESPLESFTQPFKNSLWFALGISVMFVGVAIYILDRNSPFEQFEQQDTDSLSCANNRNLNNETRLTLGESFWFASGILLNSGISEKTPKSFSSRLLGITWCAFCLIFVSSFTANLAASLVLFDEKETNMGINDQRFRNPSDGFSFATVLHTNTYQYFKRQIEFSTMFRMMENYNVKNSRDAIQALLNGSLDAFIWDSNRLDYEAARNCELRTRGPIFGRSAYAVALQKNSPWVEHISTAILQLSEDGTLASLNDKWIMNSGHKKCQRQVRKTPARLGLHNMYEIFIMLAIGIVVGALLSALEVLLGRRNEQKMKQNQLAQSYAYKWRSHLAHSSSLKRAESVESSKKRNRRFFDCFSSSPKRSASCRTANGSRKRLVRSRSQLSRSVFVPQLNFSKRPSHLTCSKCRKAIRTVPRPVVGSFAVISSIFCVLFGLWPCSLAPCFLQCFSDFEHRCPICGHVVGRYRRGRAGQSQDRERKIRRILNLVQAHFQPQCSETKD